MEGRGAGDVVACCAFWQAAAEDHVLDFSRLDLRTRNRFAHDMRGHRDPMRLVERAACRAGDAGPAVGDDSDVFHGQGLDQGLWSSD